jgi:hypothetical protein
VGTTLRLADVKMLEKNPETVLTGIKLYPNPATSLVNIVYESAETAQVEINIKNVLGATLKKVEFDQEKAGNHKHPVDVSNLVPGLYLLNIEFQGEQFSVSKTYRFVVTR